MLCAPSPKLLDRAIELLLDRIVIIFNAMCLEINCGVGKTECMLKYRGKHSTMHYHKHCTGGKFTFDVPGNPNQKLAAGDKYRHVGGVTCLTNALTEETDKGKNQLCQRMFR